MPAIPLPFVIALLLAIIVVRLAVDYREGRIDWPPVLFAALSCAMVLVVALRWTTEIAVFRLIQPYMALTLPPSAFVCFALLTRGGDISMSLALAHLSVPCVLAAATLLAPSRGPAFDILLPLVFGGYGLALVGNGLRSEDAFPGTRLGETVQAGRASLLAGAMLLASAAVDGLVALDFTLYQGRHVIGIIASANLGTLLLLVAAVAMAGRSSPASQPVGSESNAGPHIPAATVDDAAEEKAALDAFDSLMRDRHLYRDPDLTLDRMARKVRLPARQISRAVNRHYGKNLSQVVNEYRIDDAKRLLVTSDQPITTILFECGFQTKSNFNREFLRVTGKTPSDFRRSAQDSTAISGSDAG